MEIGGIKDDLAYDLETIKSNIDKNDVRVINDDIAQQMRDKIDDAKRQEILLAVLYKLLLKEYQLVSAVMYIMTVN